MTNATETMTWAKANSILATIKGFDRICEENLIKEASAVIAKAMLGEIPQGLPVPSQRDLEAWAAHSHWFSSPLPFLAWDRWEEHGDNPGAVRMAFHRAAVITGSRIDPKEFVATLQTISREWREGCADKRAVAIAFLLNIPVFNKRARDLVFELAAMLDGDEGGGPIYCQIYDLFFGEAKKSRAAQESVAELLVGEMIAKGILEPRRV